MLIFTEASSVTGNNCDKCPLPLTCMAEQQAGRLPDIRAHTAVAPVSWYQQESGETAFFLGTPEYGYGGERDRIDGE